MRLTTFNIQIYNICFQLYAVMEKQLDYTTVNVSSADVIALFEQHALLLNDKIEA